MVLKLQIEHFTDKKLHFIEVLKGQKDKKTSLRKGCSVHFEFCCYLSQSMIPNRSNIKATGIAIKIPIKQAIINLRNPLSILVPADSSRAIII